MSSFNGSTYEKIRDGHLEINVSFFSFSAISLGFNTSIQDESSIQKIPYLISIISNGLFTIYRRKRSRSAEIKLRCKIDDKPAYDRKCRVIKKKKMYIST